MRRRPPPPPCRGRARDLPCHPDAGLAASARGWRTAECSNDLQIPPWAHPAAALRDAAAGWTALPSRADCQRGPHETRDSNRDAA
eukprot:7074289-Prymnesium_polylepis.3